MSAINLSSNDDASFKVQQDRNFDEVTNAILIEDTLNTKTKFRSEYGKKAIQEFLLSSPDLGPHLVGCSSLDLSCLINACEIKRIQKTIERLVIKGDVIHCCYIILRGSHFLYSGDINKELNGFTNPNGNSPNFRDGMFLGKNFLCGEDYWDMDIIANTDFLSTDAVKEIVLCQISCEILHQYIGKIGASTTDYANVFWKSVRLSNEIENADKYSFLQPMTENILFNVKGNLSFSEEPRQKIDILQHSRLRRYKSEVDIFTQDNNRTHLYFIISGECALLRRFPEYACNGIIPTEVDTGQRYLSGDFCFMDGESNHWIEEIMRTQNSELARNKNTNPIVLNAVEIIKQKRNKAGLFGCHKNCLFPLTRVDVLTISLSEIAKNQNLFRDLLSLSSKIYPASLATDLEIIEKYHENKVWTLKSKKDNLKNIFFDKYGKELIGEYIVHPNNGVNLAYAKMKYPGMKMKPSPVKAKKSSSQKAAPDFLDFSSKNNSESVAVSPTRYLFENETKSPPYYRGLLLSLSKNNNTPNSGLVADEGDQHYVTSTMPSIITAVSAFQNASNDCNGQEIINVNTNNIEQINGKIDFPIDANDHQISKQPNRPPVSLSKSPKSRQGHRFVIEGKFTTKESGDLTSEVPRNPILVQREVSQPRASISNNKAAPIDITPDDFRKLYEQRVAKAVNSKVKKTALLSSFLLVGDTNETHSPEEESVIV